MLKPFSLASLPRREQLILPIFLCLTFNRDTAVLEGKIGEMSWSLGRINIRTQIEAEQAKLSQFAVFHPGKKLNPISAKTVFTKVLQG